MWKTIASAAFAFVLIVAPGTVALFPLLAGAAYPNGNTVTVTITKAPPAVSELKTHTVEFKGATYANGASIVGYTCSIDGFSFVGCNTPYTFTVGVGSHSFRVRAIDSRGKLSTPAEVRFEVTEPVVTAPISAVFYNLNAGTTFPITSSSFEVTDVVASSFSICATSVTAPVTFGSPLGQKTENIAPFCMGGDDGTTPYPLSLPVGQHTITIADVAHSSPLTFTMVVKATPSAPTVSFTKLPLASSELTTQTVEFTGQSTVGIKYYQCAMDSGTFANCTSPYTFTVAAGSHTLRVKAIDINNVSSATIEAPFTVTAHVDQGPYIDVTKIPKGFAGWGTENVKTTTMAPVTSNEGAFRVGCQFSHMNFDDPLVFPGQVGRAHLHMYFGNTAVTATTTITSLLASGNSTCNGGIANRSSYWVPALVDTRDGRPIAPKTNVVYYKKGANQIPASAIKQIPNGLRILTGSGSNATPNYEHGRWECVAPDSSTYWWGKNIPTNCPAGYSVHWLIDFPQCWDGVNLDSADHKSHMSFPVGDYGGSCPSTHPVALPVISYNIWIPVQTGDDTSKWRLSSDHYDPSLPGGYSMHADLMVGWEQTIEDRWYKNCIAASKDCHNDLLGDGLTLFGL